MEFVFVNYGELLVHSPCTSVFHYMLYSGVQADIDAKFGCTFSAIVVRLALQLYQQALLKSRSGAMSAQEEGMQVDR